MINSILINFCLFICISTSIHAGCIKDPKQVEDLKVKSSVGKTNTYIWIININECTNLEIKDAINSLKTALQESRLEVREARETFLDNNQMWSTASEQDAATTKIAFLARDTQAWSNTKRAWYAHVTSHLARLETEQLKRLSLK
ncbi:hypothetical protein N9N67_06665 [Bacteriovoracaceae bacterium]|nr:hypothetical protein [Bacteriovoracaceae bacterium]